MQAPVRTPEARADESRHGVHGHFASALQRLRRLEVTRLEPDDAAHDREHDHGHAIVDQGLPFDDMIETAGSAELLEQREDADRIGCGDDRREEKCVGPIERHPDVGDGEPTPHRAGGHQDADQDAGDRQECDVLCVLLEVVERQVIGRLEEERRQEEQQQELGGEREVPQRLELEEAEPESGEDQREGVRNLLPPGPHPDEGPDGEQDQYLDFDVVNHAVNGTAPG